MRADLRQRREGARTAALRRQEQRPDLFRRALQPARATASRTPRLAASSLAALEERYAAERLSVQRVQRGGELLTLEPALALKRGDRLVVSARRGAFLHAERDIGPEIDDAALLSVPVQTVSVVVTSADVNGTHARSAGAGPERARRLPRIAPARHRADAARAVDRRCSAATSCASSARPTTSNAPAKHVGFVERDLAKTDLMFLAGGICAGMLLGLLKLNAGGIVLGLGTAGSILVVGLVGRLGAQPLPGVRRDTRAGAAAADGHRPDRVHRRRRHARRASRRRGVSHERRRVLRQHLRRRA